MLRTTCVAALLVLLLAGCRAQPPQPTPTTSPQARLSRQDFINKAAALIVARRRDWKFDGNAIVTEDGLKLDMTLEHAYELYLQSPEKEEQVLAEATEALIAYAEDEKQQEQRLESFRTASPYLYPRVIDSASFSSEGGPVPVTKKLTAHLQVIYFYDVPGSKTRIMIANQQFKPWKVSLDVLHRQAVANLAKLEPVKVVADSVQGIKAFHLEPSDDYGCSRVLLTSAMDEMARQAGGDVRLWLPARDLVWGVSAGDSYAVKALTAVSGNLTREAAEPVNSRSFLYQASLHKLRELP